MRTSLYQVPCLRRITSIRHVYNSIDRAQSRYSGTRDLCNMGVVYITPDMRNIFAPRCGEAYTVGHTPNHHQLLKCYVPPDGTESLARTACARHTERSLLSANRTRPSPPPPTSLSDSESSSPLRPRTSRSTSLPSENSPPLCAMIPSKESLLPHHQGWTMPNHT